jgi:quercetin dioxygenase-like cupin family protein
MKIEGLPFERVDWENVPAVEYPGETGTSHWRTVERGGIRVRVVDYSPGFKADHWCPRGHILLVLRGEIEVELGDGRRFRLEAGSGFGAGDDPADPHLVRSPAGARVYIVD